MSALRSLHAAAPADTLGLAMMRAIGDESRLLRELAATLRRQRDALAARDLAGFDEAVRATDRLTDALEEVRNRSAALERMEARRGEGRQARRPASVAFALASLREDAAVVHQELTLNRSAFGRRVATGLPARLLSTAS